jgi:hypothetical protein
MIKFFIAIAIAIAAVSCSKDPIIYHDSCGIEIELTEDGELSSKYAVIYFEYDKLVVNEAFKYGIGDSLMVFSNTAIMEVGKVPTDLSMLNIIYSICCNNVEYLNTQAYSHSEYIAGSRKLTVFNANKNGTRSDPRTEWIDEYGQRVSGTRSVMTYSLID